MSRLAKVTVLAVVALLATATAVTAADFDGTRGDDRIIGTSAKDGIRAFIGDDLIRARGGDDRIYPGGGDDKVIGGAGDDLIFARDTEGQDYIDCGPGRDWVETIHRDDITLSNCERAWGPQRGDIR